MPTEAEGAKLASPEQVLAAALSHLHHSAGKPSTRKIAAALSSVSHTTVADALAGRRVPSWPVLEKIVLHLHGDPDAFRVLWADTAAPVSSVVAQRAVLGSGTQHIFYGEVGRPQEPAVSIAPPFGRLDASRPMRGRDELLAELVSGAVTAGHDGDDLARVHVIHGLGGCGKTRLALQVAFCAQERGSEVWWISAAEPNGLITGMRTLGRRLGITEAELEHGDAADLLWRRLTARQEPWLLVLDNADDPAVLAGPGSNVAEGRGWLRPFSSQYGTVLVTSRDGSTTSWGSWSWRHRLAVLPGNEAAAVIADYAGHATSLGTPEDARDLAERLGGLPLALKIAGSYLAESVAIPAAFAAPGMIRSYRQYRDALDAGDLEAVFPAPGGELTRDQMRGLIGRTWELSLASQIPEARGVLCLLATFADAPIPYELVLHVSTLAASPLLRNITGPRLWEALQALDAFGLIDVDPTPAIGVVQLHPLVRDTTAKQLGAADGEQAAYLYLAAILLARVIAKETGLPEDPQTWPLWQLLAPHATYIFDRIESVTELRDDTAAGAAYAANMAARYQAARGFLAQAEAIQRGAVAFMTQVLGAEHPGTLSPRHELARMMARGDSAAAEAEYRKVLAARVRVLGPEHPDTLTTRHEIARMMAERGDYAGAEAEYRDVLAVWVRVLGPEHPDTLTTRHEIARMMAERGDYAGAEAEYRDVLAVWVRVLGPEHPDTLTTRHEIARMMAERGDYAGAEAEYRDVLAAKMRVLGSDHPDSLVSQHNIAWTMAARGDHAGAEAEFRDVLAARLRVLGPDHPSTRATVEWIYSLEYLTRVTRGVPAASVASIPAAATVLVTAMTTDGWEGVRGRTARLLGRGDTRETELVLRHLEQSRSALAGLSGTDLDRVRGEQVVIWQTRLADLIERHPSAEEELRALAAEIAQTITSASIFMQNATASGRAQQAVQGQGVQTSNFGVLRDVLNALNEWAEHGLLEPIDVSALKLRVERRTLGSGLAREVDD